MDTALSNNIITGQSINSKPLADELNALETHYSASNANIDMRATPGETTRAGIRQVMAGAGGVKSNLFGLPASDQPLPTPEQNSPLSTKIPYLDVGDNVHANVSDWLFSNCGETADAEQWFVPGICENGHRVAKVISCGKDWCPVCGKIGSIAHNRRYVRWLEKIMQFKRMRYLVFTIPEDMRDQYRTKENLTELGRRIQEKLKKQGFKRGLRRWHWFGDKAPYKWHPHLNVLVEGGYIHKDRLASIKKDWAKILGAKVVDVHHKYKPTPRDMAGCLHYVTRATFLDYMWDIDMALELKGFRNMVVWGKHLWNDAPVWSLDTVEKDEDITGEAIDVEAIEKMANHVCPKCGGHLSWGKVLPARLLSLVDKEPFGAGYYQLVDRAPPARLTDTVNRRLDYMTLVRHAKILGGLIEDD